MCDVERADPSADAPRLKICIHIDETKWKKNRKLERVSIRVMNYAMAGDHSAMSVHGDEHIFPLGHFYVKGENYSVLQVRVVYPVIYVHVNNHAILVVILVVL